MAGRGCGMRRSRSFSIMGCRMKKETWKPAEIDWNQLVEDLDDPEFRKMILGKLEKIQGFLEICPNKLSPPSDAGSTEQSSSQES